jgi:hypothetical protein
MVHLWYDIASRCPKTFAKIWNCYTHELRHHQADTKIPFIIRKEAERNAFIPLSVTNKMQRYTIFFIAVNALHVLGGFFRPSSGA